MYSTHTTGCQFNFIGPFKGQINLCFYKLKIKDQLSWTPIAYLLFELIIQLCISGRDFCHLHPLALFPGVFLLRHHTFTNEDITLECRVMISLAAIALFLF